MVFPFSSFPRVVPKYENDGFPCPKCSSISSEKECTSSIVLSPFPWSLAPSLPLCSFLTRELYHPFVSALSSLSSLLSSLLERGTYERISRTTNQTECSMQREGGVFFLLPSPFSLPVTISRFSLDEAIPPALPFSLVRSEGRYLEKPLYCRSPFFHRGSFALSLPNRHESQKLVCMCV